jgi:hypothetical protein
MEQIKPLAEGEQNFIANSEGLGTNGTQTEKRVESKLAASRFNHGFRSMNELMGAWNVQISNKSLDEWRLTFPNVGQLDGFPHLGNVLLVATNGLLALFDIDDPNALFLGHLKAFNGPMAKVFVSEEDWDYQRRRRVVKVFRRHDGTYAIIPQDTFADEYWSLHTKMSAEERQLWESIGQGIVPVSEYDKAWEQICERKSEKVSPKKVKGKTQKILDML